MKRLVVSIGAAAIGSATLPHADAVTLTAQENAKPWSVAVALRGFYDDNYLNYPRDSGPAPESFGVEVRPSIGLNIPLEQTYFGFDFTYQGLWYEDRPDKPWDQSFIAGGIMDHEFTEMVTLEVSDKFIYSDRPEIADPNNATFRTDSSAINNRGNMQLNVGLSPRMGVTVGYENLYWNYEDKGPPYPSLSGTLDRMVHSVPVRLRHQTAPATVTFIGYTFGLTDYTGDEPIGIYNFTLLMSDSRNYRSHAGYVGLEHNFNPLLNLGVTAGAQFSDFFNSPTTENNTTPYGNLSFGYRYATGSELTVGYALAQAATDQVGTSGTTSPTLNRLVSTLFARVDHQFMPQLHGGLYGEWQLSDYNGGSIDGDKDNLYLLGLSLRYQFSPFLSADVGYTFDYLESDIPFRGYTRNKVYIGLTALY